MQLMLPVFTLYCLRSEVKIYTPYLESKQPSEILTIANRILGTGQLSLAKFLFITADETNQLSTKDIPGYFSYILERINYLTDIHFQTNTTIDTLDYSGTSLNRGSKVVFAVYGDTKRELCRKIPHAVKKLYNFANPQLVMPGIVSLSAPKFQSYNEALKEFDMLNQQLLPERDTLAELPLIVLCDDSEFTAKSLRNFLWITFTRCNPSHYIYGIDSFYRFKHWGCNGSLVIDARIKPHHAPILEKDELVEKRINKLFSKGGSLYGVIK